MSRECTLGEAMIHQIAATVEDGILAFHGFGSPLVQLALHLAKRTHAPNLALIAGATYAVNPRPAFLTPTSNDWVLSQGAECDLDIEELFDLGGSGRMGRMFLSGVQIDRYGNLNVTKLGAGDEIKVKLPGGGGGCNLSCDVERMTLWTTAHRAAKGANGRRRFRLVEACDFVTSVGHRTADGKTRAEMGYRGGGPDRMITELGLLDFDDDGHMRLLGVYPDVDPDEVAENTGFPLPRVNDLQTLEMPNRRAVDIIRSLDPLRIHERELRPADRERRFPLVNSR